MKSRRKPKPQPVSTIPIIREIRKALKEIAQKRKKATTKTQEKLDLEMKVLESCDEKICDIFEG
jgi:hypothetical protein